MSLFQRIRDNVSKGYRDAANREAPSVVELQALRNRTVSRSDDSATERSAEKRTQLHRDLSEIDSMIDRANKLAERTAARALTS